jgi:ATP-dependent Clp protease ATP-binding subunit ClpA
VLFGRLKGGGAVKVVVATDEKGAKSLAFEFPEGPSAPKPEKDVAEAVRERRRSRPKADLDKGAPKRSPRGGKGRASGGKGPEGPMVDGPNAPGRAAVDVVAGPVRTVPKLPLVKPER